MKYAAYGRTDVGRRRTNNEDALLIDPQLQLYAVSDGMGGYKGGEVASKTVVRALQEYVAKHESVLRETENDAQRTRAACVLLTEAVGYANESVMRLARTDRELQNMGATLTALLIVGDHSAVMAHVGDSRLYLCRADEVHQLSADHTVGQQLVDFGLISEAEQGANRHKLLRAVGHETKLKVDTLVFEVSVGDTFLLCSDGLSNYLDGDAEDELSTILSQDDLQQVTVQLVALANTRGGDDNITALCLRAQTEAETAIRHTHRSALLNLAQGCLRQTPLLSSLLYRDFARVYGLTTLIKLDAGEDLTIAPLPQHHTFALVFRGSVRAEGQLYPEGSYFGVLGLLGFDEPALTLVAEEPCQLILLQRELFVRLAEGRPRIVVEVQRRLIADLAQRAVGPTGRYVGMTPAP